MKENFITYEDGNFTGPIGKEFYVHSGGFKRILQTYLEIQRATNSLPSKDNQHLQKIATSKYFWQCKLESWILQYTLNKFHRATLFVKDETLTLEHANCCSSISSTCEPE